MDRKPMALGLRQEERGKPKASQIRGAPDYPVENLYPIHQTEGIVWSIDQRFLLSIGLMFHASGIVSYAPAMVQRMRIKTFRVCGHIDAFDEDCRFSVVMRYLDREERLHEQYSEVLRAGDETTPDRVRFDVPLEHLYSDGWFTCAVGIELHEPLRGEERALALSEGRENPMMPVLLRGAWLEVRG